MNKKVLFILSLIFSLNACATYEKEISTSLKLSRGCWNNNKNKIVFLRAYKLYQAPTGLSRFPDGGSSKSFYKSVFVYKYNSENRELNVIDKIPESKVTDYPTSWISLALEWIYWDGNKIIYEIKIKNRETFLYDSSEIYIIDENGQNKKQLSENDEEYLKIISEADKSNTISINEIKELIKNTDFKKWKVPSPLKYCKKSLKDYSKDIVLRKGDSEYRTAIIDKLNKEKQYELIKTTIRNIEKRLEKLEGYKKTDYGFYSEKIIAELKEALG